MAFQPTANSALAMFNNSVLNVIRDCIIPPIVDGLREKGVDVTIDDIIKMINLPITRSMTPASGQANGMGLVHPMGAMPQQPVLGGLAAGPASNTIPGGQTGVKPGGCKRVPTNVRDPAKKVPCNKPVAPGSEYCNACLKLKCVQKILGDQSGHSSAPALGAGHI